MQRFASGIELFSLKCNEPICCFSLLLLVCYSFELERKTNDVDDQWITTAKENEERSVDRFEGLSWEKKDWSKLKWYFRLYRYLLMVLGNAFLISFNRFHVLPILHANPSVNWDESCLLFTIKKPNQQATSFVGSARSNAMKKERDTKTLSIGLFAKLTNRRKNELRKIPVVVVDNDIPSFSLFWSFIDVEIDYLNGHEKSSPRVN